MVEVNSFKTINECPTNSQGMVGIVTGKFRKIWDKCRWFISRNGMQSFRLDQIMHMAYKNLQMKHHCKVINLIYRIDGNSKLGISVVIPHC